MSAATVDLVVMIVVGVLLGAIMKLFGSVSGMDDSVQRSIGRARRSFKERLADAINPDKVRAQNAAQLKAMPRSSWVALIFIYGLVIMLIAVVRLSPISMRWLPFLSSLFGAYILCDWIFARTRASAQKTARRTTHVQSSSS